MSLDDALNLRELSMKLIILLLMCQPCARRCRSLLPVGNLDLKHGRNKHVNLAGMDTDKESRGVLLQILGADMKRGQFFSERVILSYLRCYKFLNSGVCIRSQSATLVL